MLLIAARRQRLAPDAVAPRHAALLLLPIEADAEAPAKVATACLLLARTHRLTAYDAAYLELALRLHLPLATRDAALAAAATAAGVALPL